MLAEVTIDAILDVVREVDETGAFLHSRDEPDFSTVAFLRGFEGAPGFHLFAWMRQDQAAGFISLLPDRDDDTLSIGPMYIRPTFQGQSLGRAQFAAVVEWAGARGIKHLYVRTWGGNVRARRIFQRAGFRLVEEILDARVNGDSTVYYLLDIEYASW
ncbi:MAG: GNAT family N-acetyltransferase [Anaerolineae bacterium]|nr:GNAT family N-acetyltransferase [Anaerolineae bacterium]